MSSLRLEGIARTYGARPVLEGVSLGVEAGRVTALVGENGAGKSTLLKIAAGLVGPDRGEVRVDDRVLPTADPLAAQTAGIGVVHQHFMLIDTLSVADNVALGLEPRRGPLGLRVDRAAARARVVALSARHGLPVNPDALTGALSVGERQRVEILKVLYRGARVVLGGRNQHDLVRLVRLAVAVLGQDHRAVGRGVGEGYEGVAHSSMLHPRAGGRAPNRSAGPRTGRAGLTVPAPRSTCGAAGRRRRRPR